MEPKVSNIFLSLFCLAPFSGATPLAPYNVDPNSVSVSGLSSGGAMAVQLGIAYSDTFKVGFGVFAGLPFDCARNQLVRLVITAFCAYIAHPLNSILCVCTIITRVLLTPSPT